MTPWIEHAIDLAAGTLVVGERPGPDRHAPVVLLLHGFTGSGLGWRRVAEHLPEARVLAPDLPGHGRSRFADEEQACRMETASRLLARALDEVGAPRCTVGGYSMGGRLALHFALSEPGRVDHLVLESASPGLPTEAEREARRRHDEDLAISIERDGVEAFLARWQTTPVLASQLHLPEHLRREADAERRDNRAAGLSASLRAMGTGVQPWLGDRLHELDVPVTLVAGQDDAKFLAIASEMAARISGARLAPLPAGHNVHLEHPRWFARLLDPEALQQGRDARGDEGRKSRTAVRADFSASRRTGIEG